MGEKSTVLRGTRPEGLGCPVHSVGITLLRLRCEWVVRWERVGVGAWLRGWKARWSGFPPHSPLQSPRHCNPRHATLAHSHLTSHRIATARAFRILAAQPATGGFGESARDGFICWAGLQGTSGCRSGFCRDGACFLQHAPGATLRQIESSLSRRALTYESRHPRRPHAQKAPIGPAINHNPHLRLPPPILCWAAPPPPSNPVRWEGKRKLPT